MQGLPCGLSPCPSDFYFPRERRSTERLYEEFPAYGPVLLKLALPNLRTVRLLLLPIATSGAPAFLWRSSRRREDRTLSSRSEIPDPVWRKVSEDSRTSPFEPFLLIARTARIFTAVDFTASSGGYTGCPSIWPDFITTVVRSIVTAAVYRGFSLRLHLTADRAL